MTIQLAAAVLALSGALANGRLPGVQMINPSHMRQNAILDFDLRDAYGQSLGRANINTLVTEFKVQIHDAKLAEGSYRAYLTHSRTCFAGGGPQAHELIDVAIFKVGRNAEVVKFAFMASTLAESLRDLIAEGCVVLQVVPADSQEPIACGGVYRERSSR